MMVLQDYGTHYERTGFAVPAGFDYTSMTKSAGLDELASTTNGIPTVCPTEDHDTSWYHSSDTKTLAWLRGTRKVTITLG
jgi:hypothetical protein